jgi:hypothetical protein
MLVICAADHCRRPRTETAVVERNLLVSFALKAGKPPNLSQ